jgi:hypothetical protein
MSMTPENVETQELSIAGIAAIEAATFNGDLIVMMGAPEARLEVTLRGKAAYKVETLGKLLYISVKKRGMAYAESGASIRLWLPSHLRLKLAAFGGLLQVQGLTPKVEASTVNGAIETIDTGQGELHLSTVNGPIGASGAEGLIKASTVNGDMTLARLTGQIDASTVKGAIRANQVQGRLRISAAHGAIQAKEITCAPGATGWIKTGYGAVTLTGIHAPGGLKLVANGHSIDGQFDLPVYTVTANKHRLIATLPGAQPAQFEIATPGEVRIMASL